MSKDTYWFRHDSNARNDEKILELRAQFGIEGYGIYFALIEIMRESANYELRKATIGGIALNLAVGKDHLLTVLERCKELGLTYERDVGKETVFGSESLKRRMAALKQIQEERRQSGKKGGEAKREKGKNVPSGGHEPSQNPAGKDYQNSSEALANTYQSSGNGVANAKQMPSNGVANLYQTPSELSRVELNREEYSPIQRENTSHSEPFPDAGGREDESLARNERANNDEEIPTIEDVITHGAIIGLDEASCRRFWYQYDGTKWMYQGSKIRKWRSILNKWKVSGEMPGGYGSQGVRAAPGAKDYANSRIAGGYIKDGVQYDADGFPPAPRQRGM